MRLHALLSVLFLVAAALPAAAQDYAHPWDPRSGDDWTDRQLADINAYASRHRAAFIDELVRYFDVPRALADDLLVERRWAPGDIYYASAIARVAGRPARTVLDAWAEGHGDGWAPIMAEFGIAPGSPEALRLKQAITDSYGRWARPLEPDAAPGRAAKSRKPGT